MTNPIIDVSVAIIKIAIAKLNRRIHTWGKLYQFEIREYLQHIKEKSLKSLAWDVIEEVDEKNKVQICLGKQTSSLKIFLQFIYGVSKCTTLNVNPN